MLYRTLSDAELVQWAQNDLRFQQDPLFTELVLRVNRSSTLTRAERVFPTVASDAHVRA